MTEPEIYSALTEIFEEILLRENIELRPEYTAKDIEGWDSHKQIEMLLLSEERFEIKFNSREIDGIVSVGHLVKLIGAKTA